MTLLCDKLAGDLVRPGTSAKFTGRPESDDFC